MGEEGLRVGVGAGGGGEGVGELGERGDDGGGFLLGEAEAGLGVDDVGVAGAVDGEVLVEVTGGGDGAVFERESGGGGEVEGAESDVPAVFFGWGVAEAEVTAGDDEGLGEAGLGEVVEDEVGSVAFGDASEVELHAGLGEGGGLVFLIEDEVLVAGAFFGVGEGFG